LPFGEFLLQVRPIAVAVGRVARLHGQLAHALQHVAHFGQRAFRGLSQRDAVIGIADGHVHPSNLGAHALGDGQAGGIVLGAVDAQTRRQALHGGGQRGRRAREVALRVERNDVGIDGHRHDEFSFKINDSRHGRRLCLSAGALRPRCLASSRWLRPAAVTKDAIEGLASSFEPLAGCSPDPGLPIARAR
jgi:hypothetical protein